MRSYISERKKKVLLENSLTKEALDEYGYDSFMTLKRGYELRSALSTLKGLTSMLEYSDFYTISRELPQILGNRREKKKLEALLLEKIEKSKDDRKRFWGDEYNYFDSIEKLISKWGMYDIFCSLFSRHHTMAYPAFNLHAPFLDVGMHFYTYTFTLFSFHEWMVKEIGPALLHKAITTEFVDYLDKPNDEEGVLRQLMFDTADNVDLPALFGAIRYALDVGVKPYSEPGWLSKLCGLVRQGLSSGLVSELMEEKMARNGFSKRLNKRYGDLYGAEMGILGTYEQSGLRAIGAAFMSSYDRDYLQTVRRDRLYFFDGELIIPKTGDDEMALLYYRSVKEGLYDSIRKPALAIMTAYSFEPAS